MTYHFRTPNGKRWTAEYSDGWIRFEEDGTRRSADGPCEQLFDPTDEELSYILLRVWKSPRGRSARIEP